VRNAERLNLTKRMDCVQIIMDDKNKDKKARLLALDLQLAYKIAFFFKRHNGVCRTVRKWELS